MPNSFTSSFKRFLFRVFLVPGRRTLGLAFAASVALVKYAVEPNDRVDPEPGPGPAARRRPTRPSVIRTSPGGSSDRPSFRPSPPKARPWRTWSCGSATTTATRSPAGSSSRATRTSSRRTSSTGRPTRTWRTWTSGFWQRFLTITGRTLACTGSGLLSARLDGFRAKNELRWGWIVGGEHGRRSTPPPAWRWRRRGCSITCRSDDFRENRVRPELPAHAGVPQEPRRGGLRRHLAGELGVLPVCEPGAATGGGAGLRRTGGGGDTGRGTSTSTTLYAQPEYDRYFRDMDHLNDIGAPLFTAKAVAACFGPVSGSFASTPKWRGSGQGRGPARDPAAT